jgi:cytidine deaminase
MTSDKDLVNLANKAREHAYARYSAFKVGAAILDGDGATYAGCNVENAAYPLGACAEAGAISAMVAGGGREIRTIAIVGGREVLEKCPPCGGCRQRIAEFATPGTRILLLERSGEIRDYSIADLLPLSFALKDSEQ